MFAELKSWFARINEQQDVETNEMEFVLEQAKFLLTQAALVQAPEPGEGLRLMGVITPYGYMNPVTFHLATRGLPLDDHGVFMTIPGAKFKTKWILTDLMPEGTMIMGPNVLPGVKPLIDAQIERERREAL